MQKFETLARPLFLSLALILGLAALSSRACEGGGCNYGYNQYRPYYGHENYGCDAYGRRVVIVEVPRREVVVTRETVVAPVVKTEVVQQPVVKTEVVQQPVIVTETPKVVTDAPKIVTEAPKTDAPVQAPIETANKDVTQQK